MKRRNSSRKPRSNRRNRRNRTRGQDAPPPTPPHESGSDYIATLIARQQAIEGQFGGSRSGDVYLVSRENGDHQSRSRFLGGVRGEAASASAATSAAASGAIGSSSPQIQASPLASFFEQDFIGAGQAEVGSEHGAAPSPAARQLSGADPDGGDNSPRVHGDTTTRKVQALALGVPATMTEQGTARDAVASGASAGAPHHDANAPTTASGGSGSVSSTPTGARSDTCTKGTKDSESIGLSRFASLRRASGQFAREAERTTAAQAASSAAGAMRGGRPVVGTGTGIGTGTGTGTGTGSGAASQPSSFTARQDQSSGASDSTETIQVGGSGITNGKPVGAAAAGNTPLDPGSAAQRLRLPGAPRSRAGAGAAGGGDAASSELDPNVGCCTPTSRSSSVLSDEPPIGRGEDGVTSASGDRGGATWGVNDFASEQGPDPAFQQPTQGSDLSGPGGGGGFVPQDRQLSPSSMVRADSAEAQAAVAKARARHLRQLDSESESRRLRRSTSGGPGRSGSMPATRPAAAGSSSSNGSGGVAGDAGGDLDEGEDEDEDEDEEEQEEEEQLLNEHGVAAVLRDALGPVAPESIPDELRRQAALGPALNDSGAGGAYSRAGGTPASSSSSSSATGPDGVRGAPAEPPMSEDTRRLMEAFRRRQNGESLDRGAGAGAGAGAGLHQAGLSHRKGGRRQRQRHREREKDRQQGRRHKAGPRPLSAAQQHTQGTTDDFDPIRVKDGPAAAPPRAAGRQRSLSCEWGGEPQPIASEQPAIARQHRGHGHGHGHSHGRQHRGDGFVPNNRDGGGNLPRARLGHKRRRSMSDDFAGRSSVAPSSLADLGPDAGDRRGSMQMQVQAHHPPPTRGQHYLQHQQHQQRQHSRPLGRQGSDRSVRSAGSNASHGSRGGVADAGASGDGRGESGRGTGRGRASSRGRGSRGRGRGRDRSGLMRGSLPRPGPSRHGQQTGERPAKRARTDGASARLRVELAPG